tara:strand:- start:968 stop:1360 length:393 start_codon:yes stop_codon:yes gene_type:complete
MLVLDQKILFSWTDLEELIDKLSKKIQEELPNIDTVTGIARGGLIPAVLISHKLGLKYTNVIYPNTLVVDDICDSGATLKNSPGVYTATLHYKKSAIVKPTIYGELLEDEDKWIIYPWEEHNSAPVRDNK